MAKKVRAYVIIDGEIIRFNSIHLNQSTDWHHEFHVVIDKDIASGLLLKDASKWIGKSVHISLGHFSDKDILLKILNPDPTFIGILTGISLNRSRQVENVIVIKGYSPTILLDGGPSNKTNTEKSLNAIVDKTLKLYEGSVYSGDFSPIVDAKYSQTIDYIVQYRESDYTFLNRISHQYGEWFYYDGLKIVFGKYSKPEVITMHNKEDLLAFNLEMKSNKLNFKYTGYDYIKDGDGDYESKSESRSGISEFMEVSADKSLNELYKEPYAFNFSENLTKEEIKRVGSTDFKYSITDLVNIEGSSINPKLTIGSCIHILDRINKSEEEDFGEFIVISISHNISYEGDYSNHFVAIPIESPSPRTNNQVVLPLSEPQIAMVMDVADPDSLGRIKVQFPWQKEQDETTPWIRVVTPYSGPDKGFYVVPEIGDQVMVSFENNDPDKPYMSGGFYHKDAKPENFDSKNNYKVFKTRSGSQIYISDEEGKETIKIETPDSKNSVIMAIDGGKASITINTEGKMTLSAKESITLSSKDININASNKLSESGKDVSITAENVYDVSAVDVKVSASKKADINSSGQVAITSTADTTLTAMIIKLNS